MTNYISYIEHTDSEYHPYHWIIHLGTWHAARFDQKEQLDFFASLLGFSYSLVKRENWRGTETIYEEYAMDKNIVEPFGYGGFWKSEELPEGVKPIKALSNGSIVTCYFRTLDDQIELYRPNPNAHEVYKPLSTNLHIMHQKIYGIY